MLEALDVSSGMKVLEVGTGSGYNAALLAHIVTRGFRETDEPLVITIERNRVLAEFAEANLARAGFARVVKVISGDGSLGHPERSENPIYDRIVVTAAAPNIPTFLLKQLRSGGIILAPVGGRQYQTLTKVHKVVEKDTLRAMFQREMHGECVFVPLIGEQAYDS